MKKSALGRGLDALLPEIDISGGQVSDILITDIDPNPEQPRRAFSEEALKELADSIRELGVLQPILVQQKKGRYQIIAGERRFRAARLAGHQRIPCIVRDFSEEEKINQKAAVEKTAVKRIETPAVIKNLFKRILRNFICYSPALYPTLRTVLMRLPHSPSF